MTTDEMPLDTAIHGGDRVAGALGVSRRKGTRQSAMSSEHFGLYDCIGAPRHVGP